ncbi:hypothetical protein [Gordonia sp. NPDC003585]|uniref:hypothetical protein n=1 Tax=Gordonia sp. NPDC003585 TaxID=3154275 RepID=UPI0033A037D6
MKFRRPKPDSHTEDAPAVDATPPEPASPPEFDADEVAARTLAEHLTYPTGRHTILHKPGPRYMQPDIRGQWQPVPASKIRALVAMSGHGLGHRMTPERTTEAWYALDGLLRLAGDDQLPTVDAERIATPERPTMPPASWPTEMPDESETRDIAAFWVARHCYGARGREVIDHDGQTWLWRNGEWEPAEGGDAVWLADDIETLLGRRPDARTTKAARILLRFVGDRRTATPADVAEHDTRREIAKIRAATEYEHRTRHTVPGTNNAVIMQ